MRNYYLRPLLISSSSLLFQTNFKHSSTRRHIFNSTIIYHVSIVRSMRLLLIVHRALVLWNAAAARDALARAALQQQLPVLLVGRRQLAHFCHSPMAQRLLARPGVDVEFILDMIRADQIGTHRPSYVNAILIQSRGIVTPAPCDHCVSDRRKPFPSCRRAAGHFGGCCANCKWRDWGSRCTFYNSNDVAADDIGGADDDPGPPGNNLGQRGGQGEGTRGRPILLLEAGSADDPIVL
jgi:hypothetical protein